MSVINKMLRDLDHRQASGAAAPVSHFSSKPVPMPKTQRHVWRGLMVLLIGATLLGAGWLWQAGYMDLPTVKSAARLASPAAAPALALPALTPVVVEPAPIAPETLAQAPTSPIPAPQVLTPPVDEAPALAAVAPRTGKVLVDLRMDSTLSLKKLAQSELTPASAPVKSVVAESVPQTVAQAAPTDASQAAQRQQQATKDAVAHAQSLWNAGSHDAAIELMQEVLASSERAGGTAANPQSLVMQVRELTRMLLADAKPGPALELLIRLEPQLGNQPDLWAVRANAAQRLGRHQDSVYAYMAALQARPNEQRWLLGAAVSLAALGQTASAADMASKARAQGVVSKEVLTYLRQAGVPVRD